MRMENMEGFSDVANLRRFEEIKRFTLEQCNAAVALGAADLGIA